MVKVTHFQIGGKMVKVVAPPETLPPPYVLNTGRIHILIIIIIAQPPLEGRIHQQSWCTPENELRNVGDFFPDTTPDFCGAGPQRGLSIVPPLSLSRQKERDM